MGQPLARLSSAPVSRLHSPAVMLIVEPHPRQAIPTAPLTSRPCPASHTHDPPPLSLPSFPHTTNAQPLERLAALSPPAPPCTAIHWLSRVLRGDSVRPSRTSAGGFNVHGEPTRAALFGPRQSLSLSLTAGSTCTARRAAGGGRSTSGARPSPRATTRCPSIRVTIRVCCCCHYPSRCCSRHPSPPEFRPPQRPRRVTFRDAVAIRVSESLSESPSESGFGIRVSIRPVGRVSTRRPAAWRAP
jgi:hypothetical protein